MTASVSAFFRILFQVPLTFYLLVLPVVFLFCLPHERKPHFGARLLLSLVFVLLISVLDVLFLQQNYVPDASYIWLLLQYTVYLLSVFLILRFLYSVSGSTLLMDLLAGYSLNQIFTFAFYILSYRIPLLNRLSPTSVSFYAAEAVWFIAAYFASYFLIIRRNSFDGEFMKSQPLTYCSLGISLFLVAFNIIRFFKVPAQTVEDYMCIICMMLFYILILLFQNGLFQVFSAQKENFLNQRIWEEKEASLRVTQEAINTINIKYHDLKHMVSMLQGGKNATEFAAAIADSLSEYDSIISTGSSALDIILTEKTALFQRQDISFNYIADGTALSFMKSVDIISIFSNALDNAYEAVLQLPGDRREITMVVRAEKGMLVITVSNAYSGSLRLQNGLPETTKSDKTFHGFGTRSILQTVNKYHGDMQIRTSDQIFKLMLLIPLP